ncbi:MAG: DUF2148 domain-containing protein [bacterium]|nr:DUF2148 domain-containing protein [bacterium]
MIYREEQLLDESMKAAVALLAGAIKTAPKSRGLNALQTRVVTEEDKEKIAAAMLRFERPAFQRDAQNIRDAGALVLVGMKTIYAGLECGLCKKKGCGENREQDGLCVFNLIDLGIALGSAVSRASDLKVDNRLMYTAGYAARDLGIFDREYNIIIGIPLKYSPKNIFFDRK